MKDFKAISSQFERLPELLAAEDAQTFLDMFVDGNISVNVPRYGQIGNNLVFKRYLKQVHLWMTMRDDIRYEFWGALNDDTHLAISAVLYFQVKDEEFNYKKELHIPIGIYCEMEGDKIRTARVYYSTYWVAGHNITRPAMLNEDTTLLGKLPETEKKYFNALWNSDTDTILNEVWDLNGYFMGTAYSFNQGKDLVKTLNGLFSGGRNTELRLCSAFVAPKHLVVEYTNYRSGGNPNTPSAGMAIYGYTDEGKMAYVRLSGDSSHDHTLWPTL
ncbi:MAG: hypothetical protein IJ507_08390 [Clostridia bacterium]|nr:hypothetical protein [Clostridia bacterium]